MNHVMIDLETLGTGHDAAILQIGAVCWSDEDGPQSPRWNYDPDARYAADIEIGSALRFGNVSPDTLDWWAKQQRPLPASGTERLDTALIRLRDWIRLMVGKDDFRVWSRGSLDIEALAYAYGLALCQPQPWLYWQVRDARTLDEAATRLGLEYPRRGAERHDAFEDAAHQARCVRLVLGALTANREDADA